MKESPKPQCIERIEHAISSMHFANKTVASAYGTGLGLLESSILVELRALPELSARELTVRIGVSPVATSRALMKLERDGLIRRRQDGRRINNIITTHGDAVFNQAFERAKITFSNAYGRLPDRSRDPFLQSLTKMVTNLKAPPAAALKEDPPLMSTIRRLTRALGFITPSAYHFSAVTPLEWHILRTLALRQPGSAPIMARSLAADIGVSSNTMFSVVRRMARRGLLTQQRNSSDKRERPLAISSAGKDLFNQGRNVARKLIARSVLDFSEGELVQFASDWEFYSGLGIQSPRTILPGGYEVVIVDAEDLRYETRSAVMRARVSLNELNRLPSKLIDPASCSTVLLLDGIIAAVVEISDSEILHYLELPSRVPTRVLRLFIAEAMKIATTHGKLKSELVDICVHRSACTEQTWKVLGGSTESTELVMTLSTPDA